MRMTRSAAFYKLNSWSCWSELEYNTRMLLVQQSVTFWYYVQQMTTAVWQFYSYWYARSITVFYSWSSKLNCWRSECISGWGTTGCCHNKLAYLRNFMELLPAIKISTCLQLFLWL